MSNLIVPDDLRLVQAQKASPAIVDRQSATLYPVGDNTVTSGSGSVQSGRIEFRLPVSSFKSWDCSTMFIHFNFKINLTGVTKTANRNTRIMVHDSIESLFKTVTVDLAGGGYRLEYINDYNALETALNWYVASDYIRSFGAPCMKAGVHSHVRNRIYHTQNYAGTSVGETTNQFSVPLRLAGISSPDFVMPSSLFGSGGFINIYIDLEAPTACILAGQETDIAFPTLAAAGTQPITGGQLTALGGTSISYELSNIRMTIDAITYSAEYENMLASALASSALVYPIKTFDVQPRILAANQTRFTENLSFNYSSVNAIFAWFVRQSEQNSHLYAGKDRLVFPTNLKSFQFRVNGFPVPAARPIDCQNGATEAYVHLIESLGILHTAEQYGGLNFDQPVVNYTTQRAVTGLTNTYGPLGSYLGADTFYGKNRSAAYGFPVICSDNGTETNGPVGFFQAPTVLQPTVVTTADVADETNSLLPYKREMSPSHFLIGVNLKKLLKSAPGEVSGENLASTSGQIQYDIEFSANDTSSYVMYIAVLHDRFIELSNQVVRVNQ